MSKKQLTRYVSTISLDGVFNNKPIHARVNFSEYSDGTVVVQAVHGRTLSGFRGIPKITISKDEFYDLLWHEQDYTVFAREAFRLFGITV